VHVEAVDQRSRDTRAVVLRLLERTTAHPLDIPTVSARVRFWIEVTGGTIRLALPPNPFEVNVNRAVDLPVARPDDAACGAHVKEERRERGKDQARRAHLIG
jgi:hypothetical protein